MFGRHLQSKESRNILQFIREIHLELPIKTLITDNGREFNNKSLDKFCTDNRIERQFSVPYYHQSNGRIEGANKTIRGGIKHAKKPIKSILAKIISGYNGTCHWGIGMTPNEAMKTSNRVEIPKHQDKYAEEFKRKKKEPCKMYKTGDNVLFKKEVRNSKMDNEFEKVEPISSRLGTNAYEVNLGDQKVNQHVSQIKRLGKMLDAKHLVYSYTNEISMS